MGLKGKQKFNNFYNKPYTQKKELTINDIPKDIHHSMIFSRIYLMGFALDWQFKEMDVISTKDLNKCIDLFSKEGLIYSGLYTKTNELDRECLYLCNPDVYRIHNKNPRCFNRTKRMVVIGVDLFNSILDTWKDNERFMRFFKDLETQHKSFKQIKKSILEVEKTQEFRTVKNPDGIDYDKPTIKKRELELALMEVRAENLLNGVVEAKTDKDKLMLGCIKERTELLLLCNGSTGTDLVVVDKNEIEVKCQNTLLQIREEDLKNKSNNRTKLLDSDLKKEYKNMFKGDITDFGSDESKVSYDTNLKGETKKELKESYYGEYEKGDSFEKMYKRDVKNKELNNREFIEVLSAKVVEKEK